MLRECVRYEALAKILLQSEQFYEFFKYVEVSNFDIASDAYSTFKVILKYYFLGMLCRITLLTHFTNSLFWLFLQDLLTRHKMLSAEFLEANYDNVFDQYQKLLNSENYVTRRQSLKLLGELLLDRHNYSVMTKYISSPGILQKNRNHSIVKMLFSVTKIQPKI